MQDAPQLMNRRGSVLHMPILLGSLSLGLLSFALPIYAREFGATALQVGGLFSISFAVTTLLRPLAGWGLDRLGRKPFLIIAMLIYAAAMVLFAWAVDLSGLYLARFVQGLGGAFFWIAAYTTATDLSALGSRGQAVGAVDGAASQGALLGALVGFGAMMAVPIKTAWPVIFSGYAVLALAAAWLTWRTVPETRAFLPEAETISGSTIRLRPLLKLMVIVFITSASMTMITPLILIYLQDRLTTDLTMLVTAYIPAALVYSFLPGRLGKLSDRFGRSWLMAIGLLTSAVVSLFIPRLTTMLPLIILWALEAVGFSMSSPAQEALVADLTGSQTRGRGYGLYTLAVSLGAAVGPLLGGWLYDRAGQSVPFVANGVVLVFSALWVVLLLRDPRPNPSASSLPS